MTNRSLIFVTTITCLLLVGSGYLHGTWNGRWSAEADFESADQRLRSIPTELGSWTLVEEIEPREKVLKILQCRSYVQRRYRDVNTGEEVSVVWIAGPSGPTVAHIPEICYSSQNQKVVKDREKLDVADDCQLWLTEFKSSALSGTQFCVLYGWSNGGKWVASEVPRFEFGGDKLVYKMQLTGGSSEMVSRFVDQFLEVHWHQT